MRILAKIFKTIIGLLLIPAACAFAKAFYSQIASIGISSDVFQTVEAGMLVYLLIHTLIFKPVYIYVFGHELVHVLATWLCGGRVESFKVSSAGGSVVTSKSNVFIELSPYFVPVYALLLGPIFILLRSVYPASEAELSALFLFLVGFTLTMHFVMTAEVLKLRQEDIAKSGFIFSFVFIFIGNLIVALGVFCAVFDTISFPDFMKESVELVQAYYIFIYNGAFELYAKAAGLIGSAR